MKRLLALGGFSLFAGSLVADEVRWTASVPLWKSLSPKGDVIAAGPAPSWSGPFIEPAARLASPLRPAPEGLPRPRELPEEIVLPGGPLLPPLPEPKPTVHIPRR